MRQQHRPGSPLHGQHLGDLEAFFHYRNVDVSTIKELVRRWQPELLDQFKKSGSHQALDDIRESIAELQFYRATSSKRVAGKGLPSFGC